MQVCVYVRHLYNADKWVKPEMQALPPGAPGVLFQSCYMIHDCMNELEDTESGTRFLEQVWWISYTGKEGF